MMVRRVTHSEQTGDVIGADRQGQLGQGQGPPSVPYCTLKDTTPRPDGWPPAQTAEQKAAGSKQQQHWRRPMESNRTPQTDSSE